MDTKPSYIFKRICNKQRLVILSSLSGGDSELSGEIFKNMERIQGKEFQEEGERGEPFAVEGESAVFSQGVELGMAPVPGGDQKVGFLGFSVIVDGGAFGDIIQFHAALPHLGCQNGFLSIEEYPLVKEACAL